MLFSIYQIIW